MAIQARKPERIGGNKSGLRASGDAPAGYLRIGMPANDNRATLKQILKHPASWAGATALVCLLAALL